MLESKQKLQVHTDQSQNLITSLKAWRFALNSTWNEKAFQTLGPWDLVCVDFFQRKTFFKSA